MPGPEGDPRVLFLSRRYPPSIGGAQTHAYKLYTYLGARMPVQLVALRRQSLLHLAWFMPWAWLRAAAALLARRVDVVYFADGVTGSLAAGLHPLRGRARLVSTIFGLEMTFGSRVARNLMRAGARRCAAIAVISENSRRLAVEWGLAPERMELIYVGVEPAELPPERLEALSRSFEARHGVAFGRDRLVLNIGRQVARKGVADFVERGMPRLRDDIRFLVVGTGPEAERLRAARACLADPSRVLLLGALDDDTCAMLRQRCDLFLMPNVPKADDVEGYGIAPLEAMYSGTPVVAFAVDALVEAVREGGWLVPSGDYQAFAAAVHSFYDLAPARREAARRAAREYCRREYGWDRSAARYADLFHRVTSPEPCAP
ncbi:MAG: glycosyltransferase family 4 protein [Gemmatimonadota bacterium]